jgi:hypothetical protein
MKTREDHILKVKQEITERKHKEMKNKDCGIIK